MQTKTTQRLSHSSLCLSIIAALLPIGTQNAFAAERDVRISFRPHCEEAFQSSEDPESLFPLPSNPEFIDIGGGRQSCGLYEVEDPQTLRTQPLRVGDVLDFDIYVQNPSKQPISYIRASLLYDSNVLEGEDISISPLFPNVYPGEADFLPTAGLAVITAGANAGEEPTTYGIAFARVRMKVLKEVPNGTTVISFSDVQPEGGTQVNSGPSGEEEYVIGEEPGSLLVTVEAAPEEPQTKPDGEACETNEECASGVCTEGICGELKGAAEDESCTTDEECDSNTCFENICRGAGFKIPDGGACRRDNQCLSLLCKDFFCASPSDLAVGDSCTANTECASGNCDNGSCAPAGAESTDTPPAQAPPTEDDGAQPPEESPEDTPPSDQESTDEALLLNGDACSDGSECESNTCIAGFCRDEDGNIPTGEPCELSFQCSSGLCITGICTDRSSNDESRTIFGLLKVQNLQVTSEGSSALLSWDEIPSNDLKGYNIYFSKTPGSYIQRKSITASQYTQGERPSLTIANLTEGERYYFAVRGISNADEESAFSEEQSVIIGRAGTSTAPLVATVTTEVIPGGPAVIPDQAPVNPIPPTVQLEEMPGETGFSSTMIIFLIIGSVAGTVFFSRKAGAVLAP